MKQESVNSFDGGLNFDLNPLTTPNNVLTDCVNGTFLTFNGDEMTLQNDAGNTKILVPGTEDEWVTLEQDYYPIGIKEYGGVLYIVSAYTPDDTSTQWESKPYLEGDFVYNSANIYYEAKQDTSFDLPLGDESDENWKLIGTYKDYINYTSRVQFGSYPSPESSGFTEDPGNLIDKTEVNISDMLYSSLVINDSIFKSGRNIVFDDLINDTTHVSGYDELGYVPRFYKIKLLHQLTNGSIDLTEDVWRTYREFKGGGIINNYWFYDNSFKYYCPYQYKGKLAISAELENLEVFKLSGTPTLEFFQTQQQYEFKFTVEVVNYGDLDCRSVSITFNIEGDKETYTADVINGQVNYSYLIPIEDRNKLLEVLITPIIYVDSIDITNDLPQEFINGHKIIFSRIINTEFDYVVFEPTGQFECYTFGYGYNTSYVLKNENGDYLDNNLALAGLNESGDQKIYYFIKQGTLYDPGVGNVGIPMGEYIIINGRADLYDLYLDVNPVVTTMFENLDLSQGFAACGTYLAINDSEDAILINDFGDKLNTNT